jgi:hypothetical protein
VIQGLASFALFTWGRRVAQRHNTPSWRLVAWFPLIAFLIGVPACGMTCWMLVEACHSVESADASQKAHLLSKSSRRTR